jgi:hypothetical protein
MRKTNKSTRHNWHQILPIVCLVIVIAAAVVPSVVYPGGKQGEQLGFTLAVGATVLFVVAAVAYGIYQTINYFKVSKELFESTSVAPTEGAVSVALPDSPKALQKAMIVQDGDPAAIEHSQRVGRLLALAFGGGTLIFTLFVILSGLRDKLGLGDIALLSAVEEGLNNLNSGQSKFAALVLFISLVTAAIAWGAKAGNGQLAPFGLSTVATFKLKVPSIIIGNRNVDVSGENVIAGMRHGRPVEIRTGKEHYRTIVGGSIHPFSITSDKGKLVAATGAPPGVQEVLRSLRAHRRWEHVKIWGGEQGIVVERPNKTLVKLMNDTGLYTTVWLYDLWLAERLADQIAQQALEV